MQGIDQIMKDIDNFEHNIKEISYVLDALKTINSDYKESLEAPENILSKIIETNNNQKTEFESLLDKINEISKSFHEYDSLISSTVSDSIKQHMENIDSTNKAVLKNMKEQISKYNKISDENLYEFQNNLVELNKASKNIQSYSTNYKNELHAAISKLNDVITKFSCKTSDVLSNIQIIEEKIVHGNEIIETSMKKTSEQLDIIALQLPIINSSIESLKLEFSSFKKADNERMDEFEKSFLKNKKYLIVIMGIISAINLVVLLK